TQEVFAALHERIGSWDADPAKGSLRGWMFRVARNIAAEKAADRARLAAPPHNYSRRSRLAEAPEVAEEDRTAVGGEYQRGLLRWAAEEVRPEASQVSWRAFELTALEGRDAASAAAQLGISVGSVYTAKCRIVAKIRAKIAEIGDDVDQE